MRLYTSSRPDIDLPNVDLLTLLFDSSWGYSTEDLIIHAAADDPENAITKSEARGLVKRIAHVLRSRYGIGAGQPGEDVVLTMSCGNPFIPVFFYSIVAAGAVFSGASTTFRSTELVRQMQDANVKLLVSTAEHYDVMAAAAKQCGIAAEQVLTLDWKTPKRWTLRDSRGTDILALGNGRHLDWPRLTTPASISSTTICLLYSSGTTGLPKGVRISHRGAVASTICTMDPAVQYKSRHPDFVFSTIAHLPMANIAGIALYSINPFYMGGTTYWMPHYDFETFLAHHKRYRPHYQFSVPPIWLRIAKSDLITDHFDHLRVAVTGSAPIGHATMLEVRSKIGKGKACISQTWGTTETNGVIAALDWEAPNTDWPVGEPCPNVTLRVLDAADRDCPAGVPGELLVAGPILAQDYHNNARATADGFLDGFYRSGDIGVVRDGRVFILDRKKELIKYKGSQVAPAEIEALLTSHPRVADAAVVGVWSPALETELPRAFVVRKDDGLTEGEVVSFVERNLAPYKRLRGGVVFVESVPKSASGKILRRELRDALGGGEKAKL